MFREARQALDWAVLLLEVLIKFVHVQLTWLLIVAECLWERIDWTLHQPWFPWALLVSGTIVGCVCEAVDRCLLKKLD